MITQLATPDSTSASFRQNIPTEVSEAQHLYLSLLRSLPLRADAANRPIKTLGVTSCYSGEGVSTVVVQLSMAATSVGMRVLMVDLNWKRPSLHHTLGVPQAPGLAEALVGVRRTTSLVRPTEIHNLSLLPIGTLKGGCSHAYSAEQMNGLIRALQADYDLIIFDMLDSAQGGTGLSLSGQLDGILLVIEAERVRYEVARRVKELLVRSGARVLGAVMNKRPQHIPNWLYRTL
jgi:Mrp family chromosome partitioning ATPase